MPIIKPEIIPVNIFKFTGTINSKKAPKRTSKNEINKIILSDLV